MVLKVLAACGAGVGTSQIIKMKLKKVFDKYGIPFEITHMSVGMAKTEVNKFDLVITMAGLTGSFTNVRPETRIVGLVNLMSDAEIETKIKAALDIQ